MTPDERQEKKQTFKLAFLRHMAEAGIAPSAMLKSAEVGNAARMAVFATLLGTPALAAYNLQRLRDTAKADMKAALDIETVSTYRRAAEEANALAQDKKKKPLKPAAALPAPAAAGGLPW